MSIEPCEVNPSAYILSALTAAGVEARLDDRATSVLTVRIGGTFYRVTVAETGARPTNVVYVRWRSGEPRELEVFNPLPENHPAYNERCLWCHELLGNGLLVALFALGPVTREDRIAHYLEQEYSALAAYGHAICIYGVPPSPN